MLCQGGTTAQLGKDSSHSLHSELTAQLDKDSSHSLHSVLTAQPNPALPQQDFKQELQDLSSETPFLPDRILFSNCSGIWIFSKQDYPTCSLTHQSWVCVREADTTRAAEVTTAGHAPLATLFCATEKH